MSEDEKSSGKFPAALLDGDSDAAPESAPKSAHKVIADVHSGMVMVAPVATALDEEVDDSDEDSESDESDKSLN